MDRTTRERLQKLDARLQQIFQEAYETAIERNKTAMRKLEKFLDSIPKYDTENMTKKQLKEALKRFEQAGDNYLMQLERSEGIINSLLQEMQRSRETAASLIQDEILRVAETSYSWQVENLKGQAGSNMHFSWNMYNREEIRVLMADQGINNQPFTQIAFKRFELDDEAKKATIYRLQNQLLQGMLLGESVDVIQRRVRSQFVDIPMWQARRIARTETLRTANWGRYLAAQQAIRDYDIKTRTRWVATLDDRTRDQHEQMNGVIINQGELFIMPNGEKTKHPLDPVLSAENTVNCRCTHLYIIGDPVTASDELQAIYNENQAKYNARVADGSEVANDRVLGYNSGRDNDNTNSTLPHSEIDCVEQALGVTKGVSLDIDKATNEANPNYRKIRGYDVNCQRTVQTYELRRRGYDVVAKPYNYTDRTIKWGNEMFIDSANGNQATYRQWLTEKALKEVIQKSDNGARYIIYVDWGNGTSHVFNAEKTQQGMVRYVDPQIGNTDASDYFLRGVDGNYMLLRTDNLSITSDESILKEIAEGKP